MKFLLLLFTFVPWIVHAQTVAISSANSQATQAGYQVLNKGGNAADAAIAIALTLAVTEPQNSGLGGGGIALYYDKSTNQFSYFDYLSLSAFLNHEKTPEYADNKKHPGLSKNGVHAIGVPGFILGLEKLHKRFGKLNWETLFEKPIELAEKGFTVSDQFKHDLKQQKSRFESIPGFKTFYSDTLLEKKSTLKQKNLALTLKKISEKGAQDFYSGSLATLILKELSEKKSNIIEEDFKTYKVIIGQPQKILFKNNILHGPPTHGFDVLKSILNAATQKNINYKDIHWPAFIEKQALATKKKIGTGKNTTHISIIDSHGNIVSMTNSLNDVFGSGIILPGTGILLNNAMDNYDFKNTDIAYSIKRKNRPMSHLVPSMVFKNFEPILVIGTSGGSTIPLNLYQIMQRHLLNGQPLKSAIQAPKFYTFPYKKVNLYENKFSKKQLIGPFKFKTIKTQTTAGNIQAVSLVDKKLKAYSDPRGDGLALVTKLRAEN